MGCGAAEAASLGFVCFRLFLATQNDFGPFPINIYELILEFFFFSEIYQFYSPPPPGRRPPRLQSAASTESFGYVQYQFPATPQSPTNLPHLATSYSWVGIESWKVGKITNNKVFFIHILRPSYQSLNRTEEGGGSRVFGRGGTFTDLPRGSGTFDVPRASARSAASEVFSFPIPSYTVDLQVGGRFCITMFDFFMIIIWTYIRFRSWNVSVVYWGVEAHLTIQDVLSRQQDDSLSMLYQPWEGDGGIFFISFILLFFKKKYWIQDKGNKYSLGPYVGGSVLKLFWVPILWRCNLIILKDTCSIISISLRCLISAVFLMWSTYLSPFQVHRWWFLQSW